MKYKNHTCKKYVLYKEFLKRNELVYEFAWSSIHRFKCYIAIVLCTALYINISVNFVHKNAVSICAYFSSHRPH